MIATYRLQLAPDFGFDAVRALLPYFQRLGVSHLYLSPITEARPGSTHGYDVIDHNTVREDYGGRAGFDRLSAAAADAGLGLILDFVPNHAGVGPDNAYWQDVLAYGQHSPYAAFFDIDWQPLKEALQDKVLLPFLGRPYGEALDDGEIGLTYTDGRFYATYFDNRFALTPASYADVLALLLNAYERQDVYFDLKDLHAAYDALGNDERQKAETLRRRLVALDAQLGFADALPAPTPMALHELLEQQYWRLAYWKTAGYEINYRRFFDINELVALCMENPDVFWDAHELMGDLLTQDGVDGLRIDHVDGLFDPHDYLEHLRELGAQHIWVEKILASGETLPEAWPVEGTTGYSFMNDAMGVLLQPRGAEPLHRVYHRFVPAARPYDAVVHRCKILVMETSLSSELFRLSYRLNRLSEADYHTRDFTLEALREALAEIVAAIDRYRTYLPYDPEDARTVLRTAVYKARQRNRAFEPSVFDFIAAVVLGDVSDDLEVEQQAWTGRFQQYTAPVAAKGVEDTAFYRYLRLVALNEVGGEPDHFGIDPDVFHAHARFRTRRYPRNLLATATHDHKRGADTRMRLIALAEVPGLWQQALRKLDRLARPYRQPHGPSKADEYLLYQTLVALWEPASPADERPDPSALADRLWTYMQKASRESKQHTSWINPDDDYEAALEQFIRRLLDDARLPDVLGRIAPVLARHGFFNTLSQTVLHLTSPGVPDLYQGTELLDLSLVDPDNRHRVDYAQRQDLLAELEDLLAAPNAATLQDWVDEQDGRAKFFLVTCLLRLRQAHPALFQASAYEALTPNGADADHYLAFARTHEDAALVVTVTRFPASRPSEADAQVALPDALQGRTWTDVLTGQTTTVGDTLPADGPLPWRVLLSPSAPDA